MHLPALTSGEILFWAFALAACTGGALVVFLPNPVSCALSLVMTLCALAGLFLTLGAQFIAAVQVIVYAGAIMVLFLFVIMLLQIRGEPEGLRGLLGPRVLGIAMGLALVAMLGSVVTVATYPVGAPNAEFDTALNTQAIGRVLYTRFLVPFEVTSVLLLIALLGAVVLAKRKF